MTPTEPSTGPTTGQEVDTGPEGPRVTVCFRVRATARSRLGVLAHQHSLPGMRVGVSDVIRASLAVAANHPAELDKAIIKIRGEA